MSHAMFQSQPSTGITHIVMYNYTPIVWFATAVKYRGIHNAQRHANIDDILVAHAV